MAALIPVRLGTRASTLARSQAEWVKHRLKQWGVTVELVPIATRGDIEQSASASGIGSPGIFTKAIQQALLENHVDLAVHSLKDLPTEPVEGLALGAVPERESVADALISRKGEPLRALTPGAAIGTSSLRRRAQLLYFRRDLNVVGLRGNVDTRLTKLDAGQFDAIVLAEAGLRRLGLTHRITEILPPFIMHPAVGQGALGIEARAEDRATLAVLALLDHAPSRQAVVAERAMLAALRGGCRAPVGAWGRMERDELHLSAVVLSYDGAQRLSASASGQPDEAPAIGEHVAHELLASGAAELIQASRAHGV
jgi:hydroxymethylbilane synthase